MRSNKKEGKEKKEEGAKFEEHAHRDTAAGIVGRKFQAKALAAWKALPLKRRKRIRKAYKARRDHFTPTDWYHKQREAGRTDGREGRRKAQAVDPRQDRRIAKGVREALSAAATPRKPFVALMRPMAIVPDSAEGKPVVADAGTIVKLADMTTLHRDRMSPVTRRADELLVEYGNAKKQDLGWIAGRFPGAPDEAMKPSRGPTFLVKTSGEDALSAWDRLRLKMARSRAKDPTNWIAPWLAHHGAKHPRELREVTRLFGGKTVKNEEVDARIERLFTLILHTELDMATAKSKKSKKLAKKGKDKASRSGKRRDEAKKSRSGKRRADGDKPAKKKKASSISASPIITRKYDEHVIKRLVKENPFREGSNRAKLWAKLKKGMTVGEFNAFGKGRARTELRGYIENGWAKLRRPAA